MKKELWIGLLNDQGEEIGGSGYCRQLRDPESEEKTFPRARGPWGWIAGIALFRDPEGGAALDVAPLSAPIEISTGESIRVSLDRLARFYCAWCNERAGKGAEYCAACGHQLGRLKRDCRCPQCKVREIRRRASLN